MEHYYKEFVNNLKLFITELDTYHSTQGTTKFLLAFDKLNMVKIISRYHKISTKYLDQINNKSEYIIFEPGFNLFPGINLKYIWSYLDSTQKNRLWIYLQLLYLSSDFIINTVNDSKNSTNNNNDNNDNNDNNVNSDNKDNKDNKDMEFNPYEGINKNNSDINISLEDLKDEVKEIQDNKPTALGALGSMFGINVDIDSIMNEFKNINTDEIENATNNIKDLLGSNVDNNTSTMINDLLTDISSELKQSTNNKENGSNPLDNMINIAKNVADKIMPNIKNKNINVNDLWKSTQDIAEKCKQNNTFGEGQDPIKMINSLMNNKNGQDFINNIVKQMGKK